MSLNYSGKEKECGKYGKCRAGNVNSEIRKWSGNPQYHSASLLPVPCSLFPVPCSLFPVPFAP
ncbi:hypothetical protein [Moorena producens]|uniref:hypothetical protein n=1 Tax=Moorena producens TaxID=1155739 RepID=UPI003C712915